MSIKNLKFKGITWFGDVFEKFGAILDDAEVASKDAIHYVEGQVKNVNEFCTDVVQDLLPHWGDHVDHKDQRLPDNGSCVEEIIIDGDLSLDSGFKESPLEPKATDPVENGELDLVTRFVSPSADYPEEVESALLPQQTDEVVRNEKLGVSIEENTVDKSSVSASDAELIFHSEKEPLNSSSLSDNNSESSIHYQYDVSPSTSDYAKDFRSPLKVRMISSYFTDDLECPSASTRFATYSEMDFPSAPIEKQITEVGAESHSSSLSTKSQNLATNAVSCDDAVSFDEPVSDSPNAVISSTPPPVLSSNNDGVAVEFVSSSSVPVSELAEENTSRINKTMSLTGPSGNEQGWFHEHPQSRAFVPSFADGFSEDSSGVITDLEMETIDLLDEVKGEESCVDVNNSELYAASQRVQKLRSYKKKIVHAFSSKKRLAKEYEQLAIWFGDTDIQYKSKSHDFVPAVSTLATATATATATSLDSTSSQTDDASDSEWELL